MKILKLKIKNDIIEVPEDMLINTDNLNRPDYRTSGNLCAYGFYLPKSFNWIIAEDDRGELVLIAAIKGTFS